MIIIKKFTALKIETDVINGELKASFIHGETIPDTEFNSEEEAAEYAFKQSPHGTWLIIPIIRFKN